MSPSPVASSGSLLLFYTSNSFAHISDHHFFGYLSIFRGWCLIIADGYWSELLTLVTLVTSHSVVSIVWRWSSAGSLEMEAASRWLLHSSVINQSNVSPSFQLRIILYTFLYRKSWLSSVQPSPSQDKVLIILITFHLKMFRIIYIIDFHFTHLFEAGS